eukprot:scaffold36309_cov148-Isochrysis_galbana.AAC.3
MSTTENNNLALSKRARSTPAPNETVCTSIADARAPHSPPCTTDDKTCLHTPVTSGAGPFSWRAWIPNERSFEVSGSLQSLTLRLTDHRNRALVSTDGSDVGFSCTIGVEVLIKHNVRTLGYGPSPNPVDPKDSKLYIP